MGLALLILFAIGVYGFYWSWVQKNRLVRERGRDAGCRAERETVPVEDLNFRLERRINGMPDPFYSVGEKEDIVVCVSRLDRKPIILPSASRRQHLQILGPTGCGKSMLAQTLIAQDLMNPRVAVFVLEPKGGDNALVYQMRYLAERLGRKVYLVDPTNSDSAVILPLSGEDLDEVAEINVSAFLMYLGNRADQFYRNKQETALRMAVKVAKIVKGQEATYDDLLDILGDSPRGAAARRACIRYIAGLPSESYSYVQRELEEYDYELTSNPRAVHYYAGLIDYLKKLTSNQYIRNLLCATPSRAGDRAINLRQVINNAGVILVTTAVHTTKHLGYTIGRLYLSMLQSEIFYRMRTAERRSPLACYVDEVQNYVNDQFAEVFEMGRSADVMVTVIHQTLEQLGQISQRLEQSVFTNARQKIVFGGINAEDAERIAREIGQTYQPTFSFEYEQGQQGLFRRREEDRIYVGQREELKWVITPTEIMKLPGFDPKSGEPAHVLCLLTIDNRPLHAFGAVRPVCLDYMKPVSQLESGATDSAEARAGKEPAVAPEVQDAELPERLLGGIDASEEAAPGVTDERPLGGRDKSGERQQADQIGDILSDLLLRRPRK